jgi:catecholate siderophore receptor
VKHRTFRHLEKKSPRRRRWTRLFVLGATCAATVTGLAHPAAAQTPAFQQGAPRVSGADAAGRVTFQIAPGSLEVVFDGFTRATGLKVVLADSGIGVIQSPGVSGRLTPIEAMELLLEGTSVRASFAADGTVTVDVRGVSEFVEVTGQANRISSPKFTRPLRDIPQTLAVVPKEVIQAQGATTLRDVLRNVPGITYQAGEGGGGLPGDNLTLRGFSAGNDMFIDGVRDPGGYSRDAFNLEQVEVAKGPSSSIAGRGSTGGAINQVTKSPALQEGYSGSFGIGNSSYSRGTVDMNTPVGDPAKGIALRLNAMWTDSGVPGRDVVENAGWGVAPSLSIGLGKPTQVTLKYQRLEQDNVPDYGLPWGASAGFPTGAFQATPPVDQTNFYGLRDYDFERIASDVATGEVSHRFNSTMVLRNITRYSNTERDSAITAPRPPNRQLQRRTMGNGNVANQTSLTAMLGRGAVRHDVVTGVEFSRETTDNRNSAQATNQPQTNILTPNPDERPLGPMPDNIGNPSETNLRQAAAYVFDTVSVGRQWQFTGGARLDNVDVDYSLTTLTTGEVSNIEGSDSMLSWRAGAVFKPRVEGSIYFGYGTSFNPSVDAAATGAALSTAPTSANNPSLEPEETRNLEVGTKWDALGGRLALNGALFRTEKVNARTRNANNDPFVLSGKQRVQGVELGVSGNITDRWTALIGYAYMDSDIVASANAAEEGQNLTLTPKSTFNAWTTVSLPGGVTVGGGAQYMDAVFRNTTNTTSVPSYWLYSSVVSYAVNENLTLRVNGQNLGDKEYVDRVGGGHYIPGPRRQVLLNADVRF